MNYAKIFKTDYSSSFIEQLHTKNYGLYLYDEGIIDYPLYRAIMLIIGYKGYRTRLTKKSDLKYTSRELGNRLFKNVFLWYKRSHIKLPRALEKMYIQRIKKLTKIKKVDNFKEYNHEQASRYEYRLKSEQHKEQILAS